jgi:hypothetical protein
MRSLLVAVAAALLVPAGLWAEEIRGTVKSVDASKNRLTVMVGQTERVITVDPKVRVTMMQETSRGRIFPRRTSVQEYLTTLSSVPPGASVTVMTSTTNGTEIATSVQTNSVSGTTSSSMSSSSSSSGERGGRFLSRIFRR